MSTTRPSASFDEARALDDLVDLELVVVARAAEDADAGARETLLGHPHPLVDRLEHLLLEEAVPVALVLRSFWGAGIAGVGTGTGSSRGG